MNASLVYDLLADAVLVMHFLFALFLVAGLLLIFSGGLLRWQWVKNPWFRWAHAGGTVIVAVQAWIGVICPVTSLEMWLRSRAGDVTYDGAFIAHWLGELLYYDLPAWVFILAYSVFAAGVAAAWVWIRPGRF